MRKFLVGLVLLAFVGATPVLAAGAEGTPDPVDIIILVDESASLSSAAVRSEKEALRKIVSSIVISNEGIRLGILPFSSGSNSPRSVPECDLTETDSTGIENLTTCVDQVTRQEKKGQRDTNFAQAIETAVSNFSNSQATKIVVLLTDGKYDPDGNESISPAEQKTLDDVLEKARVKKVSLWSLGFGKADIKALQSYIDKTFDGSESCSTKSAAVLAKGLDLSENFEKIIDSATCTGHISGSANPDFNFSISPLLSKINIEATAKTGSLRDSSVVVKDANGEEMCEEPELVKGRWRCSETLTGDNAGEWTITDRTDKDLSIDVTYSGRIKIEVTDCKIENQSPAPKIRLVRADKEEIDFGIEGVNWPKVEYKVGRGEDDSFAYGSEDLISQEIEIPGSSNFSAGDKVSLLPDPSGELLIRVVSIANCTLFVVTPSTTTSSTSTTTTTTLMPPPTSNPCLPGVDCKDQCPPNDDCGDWPPLWLKILILLSALAAAAFGFVRLRGKKFPIDVELARRNPRNPQVYDTIENIGGRSKVYFDVQLSNGVAELVTFSSKSEARYVLTRLDEETVKIKSLFKVEPQDDSDGDDLDGTQDIQPAIPITSLNEDAFNPRGADSPDAPDAKDEIFLKLIWP